MLRLQAGDDRALDALMNRWQAPIRRFLYRALRSDADAVEVAQETFVRVYTQRAKYRSGKKFSSWLYAIALNLSRDRLRRNKVRAASPLDEFEQTGQGASEAQVGNSAPDADLLSTETSREVRAAVEALPEPLKTTVLLSEYENLSHVEVAEATGCSAKAVETRLYRARALLRQSLASYFEKSPRV